MKKLLILTATLVTGGLALPAAAQSHYGANSVSTQVFVSGYHYGKPIYSKRVKHGQRFHTQRLSAYELQRYLERQRKIARQNLLRARSHSSKSYRNTGRR